MLSERQERILRLAVEGYLETGLPVGSRAIAERDDVVWGASTVRNELSALEREGYLTHPHTSAGRIPTDAGYRRYADALLTGEGRSEPVPAPELEISRVRSEVEDALRETTAALAQANDLLALVTAPPVSMATSTGSRSCTCSRGSSPSSRSPPTARSPSASSPSPSRSTPASSTGPRPSCRSGSPAPRSARARCARASPTRASARPSSSSWPRSATRSPTSARPRTASSTWRARRACSPSRHAADIPEPDGVVRALEGRVSVLSVLRSALREQSVFLCIGAENPEPALRSVSMVSAPYGLGYRPLGAVGVIGPLRMDYAKAIDSVRVASAELSRFFATVYEG